MPHLTAIVKGRVQGVGFRFFVYNAAQQLGLKGFVRNVYSGDVEVQAEGPDDKLQQLINVLRKGPGFAQVTEVATEFSDEEKGYTGFDIAF